MQVRFQDCCALLECNSTLHLQNKIIGGFYFVGGVRNAAKLSTNSQLITFTRTFIAWTWIRDLCEKTFRRSDNLNNNLMHHIGGNPLDSNLTWNRFLKREEKKIVHLKRITISKHSRISVHLKVLIDIDWLDCGEWHSNSK